MEEDYTAWTIKKFRRLIERFRAGEHMAANKDTYSIYHEALVPMEEAFKRLHPRAYRTFEQQFHAQFE